MNWYARGQAAADEAERATMAAEMPFTWFVRGGEQGRIVLIDDDVFSFAQHTYRRPGDKRPKHVTCIAKTSPGDPVCCEKLTPETARLTSYLTAMDCLKVAGKNSKSYQYGLKLLAIEGTRALSTFMAKKAQKTSLVNRMIEVTRGDDERAAKLGEWEVDKDIRDPYKMFEVANYGGKSLTDLWAEAERDPKAMLRLQRLFQLSRDSEGRLVRLIPAFNYMELFKPKSPSEVRQELSGRLEFGYNNSTSAKAETDESADDGDTIPF